MKIYKDNEEHLTFVSDGKRSNVDLHPIRSWLLNLTLSCLKKKYLTNKNLLL